MSFREHAQKIDTGRLVTVPLFMLFITASLRFLPSQIENLKPINALKVANLLHSVLTVSFYMLVVFLYFKRNTATSTTNSLSLRVVAIVSSFMPFTLSFLADPSKNTTIVFASDIVTSIGIAGTIYSLNALGKSFSIIPQVRTVVETGPYKYVRHPLYATETISTLGILLARWSALSCAAFCLMTALQIYRAIEEEKFLAAESENYRSYLVRSARFIPGIF